MRAGMTGVLSEALTVKFASISYTLFPISGLSGVCLLASRPTQVLKLEKTRLGADFPPERQ